MPTVIRSTVYYKDSCPWNARHLQIGKGDKSVNKLRSIAGLVLVACIAALSTCAPPTDAPSAPTTEAVAQTDVCIDSETGARLTYEEALAIAEQSPCVEEGPLTDVRQCNPGTGTWWIDLQIDEPGCSPACVVDVNSRSAEVNWRCTGAIPSEDTATPTSEPEAAELALGPSKYANTEYGFAFWYPPAWAIELRPQQEVDGQMLPNAVILRQSGMRITVQFARPGESADLGAGEHGEGEVADRGTVTLFDRPLPRRVLIHENKDKLIYVTERLDDLELYVQLDDEQTSDYAAIELPAWAQDDFEEIVASFKRTAVFSTVVQDPHPDWSTYLNADFDFSFRYPSTYTVVETPGGEEIPGGMAPAAIDLRRDGYLLRVQYKRAGEDGVMGPSDLPPGIVAEAGEVSIMGQPIPIHTLVHEERTKLIFVGYQDDIMDLYVGFSLDQADVPYEEIDLPEAVQAEVREVLASFEKVTSE